MKYNFKKNSKIILITLILFLYSTFGYENNNRYLIIIITGILFFLDMLQITKKKKVYVNYSMILIFLFDFLCLISMFWAIDKESALTRTCALFILLTIYIVIWNAIAEYEDKVDILIKMIFISGFLLSIYVVMYYGVTDYIAMLVKGKRIGTEINNVNAIGLYTSLSVVVCLFMILFKNNYKYLFVMLMPLIVALGTGSRKVMLILLVSTLILYYIKYRNKINITNILKILISIIVIITILFRVPYFNNIKERFYNTINSLIKGEKIEGESAKERTLFLEYGWEQFKETPILGIGINNTRHITMEAVGRMTYLHNNYIELLTSLGVIGMFIYYIIYCIPLYKSIKLLKKHDNNTILLITLLIVELVIEVAYVSYMSLTTYFIIMMLYMNLERRNKDDIQEKIQI